MRPRFVILLMCCCWCAALRAQTEDYAIDWFSLDCGGGTSSDDVYSISGTIGQPEASEVVDQVWTVTGGFWAATDESQVPALPKLTVNPVGNTLVLSWPATATGFVLEQSANLLQPDGWHSVNQPIVVINGQNTVTVPASGAKVYYRLTDTPSGLRLNIARLGSSVVLSWPAWASSYFLEQNYDVRQSDGWSLVGSPVVQVKGRNTVTVPISSATALFRLTQSPNLPVLSIARSAGSVLLSWPGSATGFYLQQNFDAAQPRGWSLVRAPVVLSDGRNTVSLPSSNAVAFFRLTRTPSSPSLSVVPSGSYTVISWPASATGFYLEQNFDLTQPRGWSLVNLPVIVINGRSTVTVPSSGRLVYYRLTDTPSSLRLVITPSGTNMILSWPASATGYYLEQSTNLAAQKDWSLVAFPVTVLKGLNTVTIPLSAGMTFYRLTSTPVGPPLRAELTNPNTAMISWPVTSVGFSLQQSAEFAPGNWLNLTNQPVVVGNRNQVTIMVSGGNAFFRLKYP